ncbi:hypothetical protein [Catellatospora paridis]|uniref:hypothetical protein n=1 Tax=Catellatospora paridis TaxID=1617086 RepID=UPI0012D44C86|nr:hypothetical protein [Catellatospora paridis]
MALPPVSVDKGSDQAFVKLGQQPAARHHGLLGLLAHEQFGGGDRAAQLGEAVGQPRAHLLKLIDQGALVGDLGVQRRTLPARLLVAHAQPPMFGVKVLDILGALLL